MISIDDQEFKELTQYIQQHFGINLMRKRHLVEGRLTNLLSERGFTCFSDYLQQVYADTSKQEVTTLVNRLTTNHTYFLRESQHFEFLRDEILPLLISNANHKDLRIWSAGCASGEEAYTLAMIIKTCFDQEKTQWDTKVLATDISVRALEQAEKGIYPSEAIEGLPPGWKLNYFHKIHQNQYQVAQELKDEVIFRVFNLMDTLFPFKKKFQVIFCRNVMIYFDHPTKLQLINKFNEVTEPGGFLFIGQTEGISRYDLPYKYIMPGVYRKE